MIEVSRLLFIRLMYVSLKVPLEFWVCQTFELTYGRNNSQHRWPNNVGSCVGSVREITISGYMMTSLIIASSHLEPSKKISIRNAFAPLCLVPFIYAMRPRVIFNGTSEEHVKQKKDGVRLCNAEKDLPKVNSTVVFDAFWLERVLNSCKFQVCNNFFWFWKNYSEVQE